MSIVKVVMLSGECISVERGGVLQVGHLRHEVAERLQAPPSRIRLALGAEMLRDAQWMESLPEDVVVSAAILAPALALTGHGDCQLRLWDLSSRDADALVFATSAPHGDAVTSLSVDWEGQRALSGSADWSLRLWALDGKRLCCTGALFGHTAGVTAVHAAFRKGMAVSSSEDGTVRLWDMDKLSCSQVYGSGTGPVMSARFCLADGELSIVSGGQDAALRVWGLASEQQLFSLRRHGAAILTLFASPDSGIVASGSKDWVVRIWDLQRRVCCAALTGHEAPVTCVSLGEEAQRLLSGSEDATLRLWDVEAGTCLKVLRSCGPLRSLDADFVALRAVCGHVGNTLSVWDIGSASCLCERSRCPGGPIKAVSVDTSSSR